MAINLSTTTQYLTRTSAIATVTPITFSCWANSNITTLGTMISISSAITNTSMFELCIDTAAFSAQIGTGAGFGRAGAHASVTIVPGTWYHCCAVFPGSGVTIIYVNGANKVTFNTLATPTAGQLDTTSIGSLKLGSQVLNTFNGSLAYPAIWSSALSDADVSNLAGGINPTTIGGGSIISYNLLNTATPTADQILGTPWTVVGTPSLVTDPNIGLPVMGVQIANNLTTTTATLNGTIISAGTSTVTTEGFNYGIDSSYGTTISTNGTYSAGAFTGAITGLLPETIYHFQSFSTNSSGTGVSPDKSFVTTAVPGTVHTEDDFIDSTYMTSVPWLTHSHWIQGHRGWMDTVPSRIFVNGSGVVFNSHNPDLVLQQLSRNNIKTIRVEFGWGGFDMNDSVTAITQPLWDQIMTACVKWGIRPLMLLNANEGIPCPMTTFNKTVAVLAGQTSTQLTLTDATGLVPFYSGFNSLTTFLACQAFVTSVNTGTGVVQLSIALPKQLLANQVVQMSTLKYKPFALPGSADYINTLNGWKVYVLNLANFVSSYVGPGGWDYEIWNELTFGSRFLDINNYYTNRFTVPRSAINGNENKSWTDIVQATVDVALANPALFTGVKISDGFSNTIPWPGASQEPDRITGINKHPYPPLKTYPAGEELNPSINALFQSEATPLFTPSYTSYFPEFVLTHIVTESALREADPFGTPIGTIKHGRLQRSDVTTTVSSSINAGEVVTTTVTISKSNPCPLGVTEMGYSPQAIQVLDGPTALLMKAKMHARALISFIGKGADYCYLFGSQGSDINFGVCQDNFITYIATNSVYPDPSVEASYTSPTLVVMKNMIAKMSQNMDTSLTFSSTRPLNVLSVSDSHNNIIFAGDGTPEHPDLHHREAMFVGAFQVNSQNFIMPYYVMTRDVKASYPLAPENFDIVISGFNYAVSTFSIYDPVLNVTSNPIAKSGSGTTTTLTVAATDYPIFIMVNDPVAPPTPGTVPIVETLSATVITTSAVTLSGKVDDIGGSASNIQGFHYGTTSAYGTTISSSGAFGLGTFTQNLTGLTPSTRYHYVAFSINDTGEGRGLDSTFATNGVNVEGFVLGPTTDYGQVVNNSGQFIAGNYQITVSNLLRGIPYHFKAFAANLNGIGSGVDSTFQIASNVPVVQTVGSIITNFVNVTLQGNMIDLGSNESSIIAGFNWGVSPTYENTSTLTVSSLGPFQFILLNLARGHTYHFRAFAQNQSGIGVGPDSTFFLPAVPSLQTLPAMFVTTTTATLFANISDFESLTPLSAGFYWGATLGYGFTALVSPPFVTGIFQATLTGLIPGALYHAQAFVSTSIGDGLGGDITFTTIQAPPADTVWQPLETIIEHVIGVSEPALATDIKLESQGVHPAFLRHGRTGDWIPDDMLALYQQMYHQAGSLPRATGIDYPDSLTAGGSSPYDGKG